MGSRRKRGGHDTLTSGDCPLMQGANDTSRRAGGAAIIGLLLTAPIALPAGGSAVNTRCRSMSTPATMPSRVLANGWAVSRETPMESGRRIVLAVNPKGGDRPYATFVETWDAPGEPRYFRTRDEAQADYSERAFREL